jgi:hypothetical protein
MHSASQKLTTAPLLWWFALVLGIALVVAAATALWQLRNDVIDGQAREIALYRSL